MEFRKEILANGLCVIGEINKAAKSAAVGFFVKAGSRDEPTQITGVSHFLEHMLFKGTDRLNTIEVNEAFDRTGAKFNAGTSEENTIYYAAVLPEYLAEVTKLWIELMRPAIREEDFSIEKNVIKEEIAMHKDMPTFDVMDKCRILYFDKHPCGNSVLGTEESIDNMTTGQMREYFTSRYAPNNMVLVYSGNFDWAEVCSIANKECSLWQKQSVGRNLESYRGSKKEGRTEKANLNCEHICLMSAGLAAQDSRRFAASLLATIVGDDVGSRFFWELVDKALAETATMQFAAMDGTGVFFSYICCRSENVTKVLDTISSIFDSIAENGVTEDELRKAKNKILSALVIKNELPMGRLVDLGANWIYLNEYRTIEDDVKAVKAVTVDDIRSLIDEFKMSDFTQFSIGPEQSK
jgi:predicted Zn-dependent peptidase